MTNPVCPMWWPLPDGDQVGTERAQELAEYVRYRAVPAIDIARAYLQQRHPGQEIRVRVSRPGVISRLSLERHLSAIPVGTVAIGVGKDAHVIRIGLDRGGTITAHLSRPSEPVMRSVTV